MQAAHLRYTSSRGDFMTIIYNKSNGKVILMMSETIEVVSSVVSDIPEGFYPSSVNPDTKEVIFAEIPKTKEQQDIAEIKAQLNALTGVSE